VAFLAIQSVDEEPKLPERSPAQLASYVSIFASIGSIILGLLLIRHNRTKTKKTALDAVSSCFLGSYYTPNNDLAVRRNI